MEGDVLAQIKNALLKARKVSIFTHIHPDGDALGSSFATKALLESEGVSAEVWLLEPVPERYAYLDTGCRIWEENIHTDADTALALDCGSEERLGKLASLFMNAPTRVCIDHHLSNKAFGDLYFCRPEAAATAELVHALGKLMSDTFPLEARIGIYTGLSTDTGHFKYSNVTENTFLAAADLIRQGLDARSITRRLYDMVKLEKYRFMGAAAERVERYAGGKLAVLRCPDAFLAQYGIKHEDIEELPNMATGIEGVRLSVLVKDNVEKGLKYSLRGRELLDLSKIAGLFGGGGHKNAAAFVTELPIDEVIRTLEKIVTEGLRDV